ncbi:Gamma-glutamyltranspeptidase protein [Salinisphaera shabanensis E1L3A]|uniref:Gamma-glutamyltranspeptidase protein n=1 Tax=Salinisphaera shabanensis E1L3A TaxID=1033802 RepID=U2EQV2_9GAMM|nr:gamma-glutamyltransferase family protein [Salinisphaera shabanensis]ERJ20120.1 Gamma-glutamyltranspeptidase protein [Salinisphaera shabanensis E1L3A]
MLQSAKGRYGCVTAPHLSAALAGRDVLAAGGNAIEAMVASAATIAVVYPHMNSIGGDGFWLIKKPGQATIGISACGRAAALATPDWYAEHGHRDQIPARGAQAALTVPATIAGWQAALNQLEREPMALETLLAPAIAHAREGFVTTGNQAACTAAKANELRDVPGFAGIFLPNGHVPREGDIFVQNALANTLETLAREGLDSYYTGSLAATHGAYLEAMGSPLRTSDLAQCAAELVAPLSTELSVGTIYNMPPPTQGVSSLMILALFDRLKVAEAEGFDHLHGLIEATKQAFLIRNAELGDPDHMTRPAESWLEAAYLDELHAAIDPRKALDWPYEAKRGDTIWMGATDRDGTMVSFIQSVFWEFGSGLTCPDTGVAFQNRGAGFSLAPGANQLAPGKRPFHTLNPAMAELNDGRVMAYGTMGGEGQPQTQAAVFSRYAMYGQGLQRAVTAPRWLLGKTWGDATTSLKLENRFDPALVEELIATGHQVEMIDAFSDLAGHAGAVVRHPEGYCEGASDPRADGGAVTL